MQISMCRPANTHTQEHLTDLPEPNFWDWAGMVWILFPEGIFKTSEKAAERPCQACKASTLGLNREQNKTSRTRCARLREELNDQEYGECNTTEGNVRHLVQIMAEWKPYRTTITMGRSHLHFSNLFGKYKVCIPSCTTIDSVIVAD